MKKKVYLDIYSDLKNKIEKDIMTEKLEPIRTLAKTLKVSPSTVSKAYYELEKNGFVTSKQGSGFYIIKNKENEIFLEDHIENDMIKYDFESSGKIDFASATPNQNMLPMETIIKSINHVLRRDKEYSFLHEDKKGYLELRKSIAKLFNQKSDISILSKNIQLISGAQQGIDLVIDSLLSIHDNIVIEEPTYRGAKNSFSKKGCNIISVPIEDDGISIKKLKSILKKYKIKCLYTMTNFQNPTGISMSNKKKNELLELADKYNFYIIEDDGLSEMFFKGKEPTTLKNYDINERVIYIKSYSKVFMPGLRLAYIIAPTSVLDNFLFMRGANSIYHFGLIQRSFQEFLVSGNLQKHINIAREKFKDKQKKMEIELKKIKDISFITPKGGLSFWIKLPENISSRSLYYYLQGKGVSIVPGIFFSNLKDDYIRISFAQCVDEDIELGMDILNKSIMYFKEFLK